MTGINGEVQRKTIADIPEDEYRLLRQRMDWKKRLEDASSKVFKLSDRRRRRRKEHLGGI